MRKLQKYEELFPAKTLENLFDKSVRLILQRGLEHVRYDEIAAASGIDLALLQEAFPTKQHILRAKMHWYYVKFGQQIRSVMAMHSDIYAAMRTTMIEFVELCFDRDRNGFGLFRATVVDLCLLDKDLEEELFKHSYIWEEAVHEKLVQCSAELKTPEDIDALTCYYKMTLVGLYEMAKLKPSEECIFNMIDLSLEALRSRMKYAPD